MRVSYVRLLDVRVPQRRVYLRVSEQDLHLLDGHSLVYRPRRHGPAEAVRMHVLNLCPDSDLPHHLFDGVHCEPCVQALPLSPRCHEKRPVLVPARLQVVLQLDLRAHVKIRLPLLRSLAEHHAGARVQVYRRAVEPHQLADPYP